MNRANDPKLKSWIDVLPDSDFPIQNLPFGIFQTDELPPRLCSAIGDYIVDLQVLAEHGFFDDLEIPRRVFGERFLNDFIALGKAATNAVRQRLSAILDNDLDEWDASGLADLLLHPQTEVDLLLPVKVGDYTDFYSSREHATNVGQLFRSPENALFPNWLQMPIAYHGRASSIVISGTPVRRPHGQSAPPVPGAPPVFGPSRQLDFELEVAFVTGRNTALGESIPVADAEDYIFGLLLFNDWSARDIQKWEYQPLGPFLGKSFASTISPWIVTLEALQPFRTTGPEQAPEPLPYLQSRGDKSFDINLEVYLQPDGGAAHCVCRSNFKTLYWNMSQQLAHQSVNGCNINVGDLYASGTISGSAPGHYGSMLEITRGGTRPLRLEDGTIRLFLEDEDTVILKGWGQKDGVRIGFGEAPGKVIPADRDKS